METIGRVLGVEARSVLLSMRQILHLEVLDL